MAQTNKYKVMVDDNFHYMDEDERYQSGIFDSYEEAVNHCKQIVGQTMPEYKPGMTAKEMYDGYVSFGEDPFILIEGDVAETLPKFSAWDYAEQLSQEIISDELQQVGEGGSFTLDYAIKLATQKHEGQFDKGGSPYITHPLSVMEMLTDEPSKMAGVLHDIVEDTPVTFVELEARGCPEQVIDAVKLVTHSEDFDGSDDAYMRDIQQIADSGNQIAIDVKWADLTNNQDLSRIPNPTDKDYVRLERYKGAKEVLRPLVSQYLLLESTTT